MSKNLRQNTEQFQFLLSNGYLDKGDEVLAEGKRAWRRIYMRRYKKQSRRRKAEHIVACKEAEEKLLQKSAREHGVSVAQFIKLACLAYCQQKYLTPRLPAIFEVRQEMIYTRSQIERVRQSKRALFAQSKEEEIEVLLQSLQATLDKAFKRPDNLETLIREALQNQPEFKISLASIMQECVSEEHRTTK